MMRIHGIDSPRCSWTHDPRCEGPVGDRATAPSHQDTLPTDLLHEIETMLEDEDPDWINRSIEHE